MRTQKRQKHELATPVCSLPQFLHPPWDELCFDPPHPSRNPKGMLLIHPKQELAVWLQQPGCSPAVQPKPALGSALSTARGAAIISPNPMLWVVLLQPRNSNPLTATSVHPSHGVSWLAACLCTFPPQAMTQALRYLRIWSFLS